MLVKTNMTDYTLDRDAILRDFDIAGVSFKKADKPEELFTALSQNFSDYGILSTFVERRYTGYYLYYLGEKGNTRFTKYREDLQNLGLSSMQAAPVHIRSEMFKDDYVLIQLLLGYLGADTRKRIKLPYGNYLGGLYANKMPYTKEMTRNIRDLKINGDTILFNRIHYTRDKTIYVNVETWMPFVHNLLKKQKRMKKFQFVMELDTYGRYMIKVPWNVVKERVAEWTKNPEDTSMFNHWYVRGSDWKGRKNAMPYYTMAPGKVLDDKLSIYVNFIREVNKELGEYLTLTPMSQEFERYPLESKAELNQRTEALNSEIVRVASDKGITIIAGKRDHQEKALLLKQLLMQKLSLPEEKIQMAGDISLTGWNIQLVDDKKKFVDKKGHHDLLSDSYRIPESVCLQHIVADTIKKEMDSILDVALVELLIKDGLLHHKLSKCLAPGRNVSVAVSRLLDTDEKDAEAKDSGPVYEYFGMTIDADGIISETTHFTSNDWPSNEFEEDIFYAYASLNAVKEGRTLKVPEGIIRFDDGNFHTIYKTTRRPLPDYAKLISDYAAKEKQPNLALSDVLAMMDAYKDINPKNAKKIHEKLERVKDALPDFADENNKITVKNWANVLKDSGLAHQNPFYADMDRAYSGKVIFQIHNKIEENNPYEIDKTYGICYKMDKDLCSYYVGLRRIGDVSEKTVRVGVPIRMVETDDSFSFDTFAALLDVLWVRRGTRAPTVLPYPFKILREFIKSEDGKKRMTAIDANK